MKRNIFMALSLTGALLLASACDDLLEQTPANYVSDKGVIVDLASAQSALNGTYHQLGVNAYYGGQYFVAGVNLAGDNVSWTGSLNYYYDFNTHQYGADNQLLSYAWYAIYSVVNQANQVIDKTESLDNVAAEEKRRIAGEATVIRSLAFFDLARTWGNVPLVRQATASPVQFAGVKQSDAQTVYREIVADVQEVYDGLPDKADRNRVSKPVADALLARVSLYAEEWEKAEAYASRLIANDDYELVDYPLLIQEKLTKESVWELSYSTAQTNAQSSYWRSPDSGGRHEWGPSKELVQLLADPQKGGTRKVLYTDLSTSQVPDYYVGNLYYRSTNDDPVYLFRIAELYLIRAEARVKKSQPDLAGALEDLNAVRRRAKVGDSPATTLQEVVRAIEEENRVEFALESHRWFDLVRTGRAVEVLGIKEYQTLFPIPYSDIEADADLIQNPNY